MYGRGEGGGGRRWRGEANRNSISHRCKKETMNQVNDMYICICISKLKIKKGGASHLLFIYI